MEQNKKQETLEATIKNLYNVIFTECTEFKEQRMYSEEEVIDLMTKAFESGFKKADVVEAGLEGKETDVEVKWILNKNK